MAIAEGQVLPISMLQYFCLNLITIYNHHAHCMLALYDVDSVAYQEHDCCYHLNVPDTWLLLGFAYTYAATNSFLAPGRKVVIQRHFGWLQDQPTLEGQGLIVRLMPMMCWVSHKVQHKHLLTDDITTHINDEDLYEGWRGAPALALCRAEIECSIKKFGTINQKVQEMATDMGINTHKKDVVMREIDYSSSYSYSMPW